MSSVPCWYMGRALKHMVPTVCDGVHFVMVMCTAEVGLSAAAEKSYV